MIGRAALWLAVGVLAGCDSSTRTIVGTLSTTYQTPHGSTDVPIDFTTTMVQALVADDSGVDYQVYAALGATDGTFEIRDVPIGDYVLQVGSAYYFTDVATFTLHTPAFGHPDRVAAPVGSSLAVTASNMVPWVSDLVVPMSACSLEAYSGDAGAWWYGLTLDNEDAIGEGLTALVGYPIEDDPETRATRCS